MFQQIKHVALTYLNWPWIWLIIPLMLFGIGAEIIYTGLESARGEHLLIAAMIGLATPIELGLQLFVTVTKRQFTNPRARLVPNYCLTHLLVTTLILVLFLIAYPLQWAWATDTKILGTLAFSTLLGGTALWTSQSFWNLPLCVSMGIFFSCMTTRGQNFWFLQQDQYVAIHVMLTLAGFGTVGLWLRRLTQMNEEMDDYQMLSIGYLGTRSLTEQAELRRLAGFSASRLGRWISSLGDRQHNQPPSKIMQPTSLLAYGNFGASRPLHSALIGIGYTVLGIVLIELLPLDNDDAPWPCRITRPIKTWAFLVQQRG